MKMVIGQRYISEMEPELGLGVVVELAHKRVTLQYSSVERIYSVDGAPIRRIIFAVGNEITLRSGDIHTVENVREESGICYYSFDKSEVSELELSNSICFTTPLDRLFSGISDRVEEFALRKMVLRWCAKMSSSPARGFSGGKIELLPHQFSVADSICSATRRRFFLADEVGLGKTIEAALAIHRLLITERISRVLIVVPSALIHQWFIELYRRFSILATVVNDDFKENFLESDENLFAYESPLIISDEDITNNDYRRAILESQWDMMVVDEAHHLSDQSESYNIVTKLSKKIPDLLLLTASPEAMNEENFFSLLQLVDPIKYSSITKFKREQKQYKAVASLADKIVALSPKSEYLEQLRKFLPNSEFGDIDGLLTVDEAESIVAQLIDVCGVGRALFRNSRSVISGFPSRELQMIVLPSSDKSEKCNTIKTLSLWIDGFLRENENEKCLIICKSKVSLSEIKKVLSRHKSRKITLFNEDMSIVQLDRSAAFFADPDGASVLISTEIGSEGRNFQYADHLILLELPEEPELLEQRIGRLDRIGRSKNVSVIVPVVEDTFQHRLAEWYDLGLNAFRKTVPGAHSLGREFISRVRSYSGNKNEWDELISETKEQAIEISDRVEKGRNRLLERASCNVERSSSIISEVKDVEEIGIQRVMTKIFDHFSITMDELSPDIYYLNFENLTDHTFPIPMMREESGMSITFDRSMALTREDVDLLTIDHPMVLGAFDLITGTEKGNVSIARYENSGKTGYLLELIFVISTPGGSALFPERYLPMTTLRVLVDETGANVTKKFNETAINSSIEPWGYDDFKDEYEVDESDIKGFISSTSQRIKLHCDKLIGNAKEAIATIVNNEISRIEQLSNDQNEIETLTGERDKLLDVLNGASYRLEGVQLIGLQ